MTIMLCRVLDLDSSGKESSAVQPPPWLLTPPVHSDRSDTLQPSRAAVSTADVQDLRSRADQLTSQLETVAKDAWAQGFCAGELAARGSLEAELRETVSKLAEKISEIAAHGPEIIRRAEADTVNLAIAIARRVLHREISLDRSALSALVGAALEKLRNHEIHRVRIHPDLEKLLKSSLEQFGRSSAIEVLPDPSLACGGVTFEISRGALDASVDTQLREIERGLVDEIRTRS